MNIHHWFSECLSHNVCTFSCGYKCTDSLLIWLSLCVAVKHFRVDKHNFGISMSAYIYMIGRHKQTERED